MRVTRRKVPPACVCCTCAHDACRADASATATFGCVGVAVQLVALESQHTAAAGDDAVSCATAATTPSTIAPASDGTTPARADDWLKPRDVAAVNAFVRALTAGSADSSASGVSTTTTTTTTTTPQSTSDDAALAPMSLDVIVRDCELRVFDRAGRRVTTDAAAAVASAVSASNALRRVLRVRVADAQQAVVVRCTCVIGACC
jgi:hypothetical protein